MIFVRWLHALYVRFVRATIRLIETLIFVPLMRKVYENLDHLGKGRVKIIDVGCNDGQSILFFGGLFTEIEVVGFEPNAELASRCRKRTKKFLV